MLVTRWCHWLSRYGTDRDTRRPDAAEVARTPALNLIAQTQVHWSAHMQRHVEEANIFPVPPAPAASAHTGWRAVPSAAWAGDQQPVHSCAPRRVSGTAAPGCADATVVRHEAGGGLLRCIEAARGHFGPAPVNPFAMLAESCARTSPTPRGDSAAVIGEAARSNNDRDLDLA